MIHIGNSRTVREKAVVGVFDADTATIAKATKETIARLQKENKVEFAKEELPKSFVLLKEKNGEEKLIFSQLAPDTVAKREN